MKPKKVGVYLFFILVIYAVALFYVVGLCGGLIGATINYLKHGVWIFGGNDFLVSLRFALVYGVWGGAGVWIFSKIEEVKRKRKV
ncbi:hypothetical protein [Pseudomonas sp. FP1742]|uniref:hypothetical protein n=1 Tax=Pseudomonas sp. FP1742 TaxID=2954079 RepID=UPI002735948B|nr:hypothetical protein [Pseudomonas sp. FP1742]WLG52312.1 hypothetical protein PSH64_07265 [Pseudomonas sp. FP1742]